jgi:multiple sugar transport system ATP-binding protein
MTSVSFADVTKRFVKDVDAVSHLDLNVGDGELLVVVGPSGCGKTTTLRILAGLEDPTEGTVSIGDRVVNDVPSRDRDIAMVFQNYALYPHLTVGGNLAYPLRLAGVNRHDREERVHEVAKQLRLSELLGRKPRQLSGGQRQRVAMGRAMVRKPSVFLMDEPLSNLDAKLRVAMRAEVSELQRSLGTTMFYVTHDQVEAMTLGDRVAVMDNGILRQLATPSELYNRPNSAFVAGFIGSPPMNRACATVAHRDNGGLTISSGAVSIDIGAGEAERLLPLKLAADDGRRVIVGARPEHMYLVGDGKGLGGEVRLVEQLGVEQIMHIDVPGLEMYDPEAADRDVDIPQRLVINTREKGPLRIGDGVRFMLQPEHVHVFDLETGQAIRPK